MTEEGTARTRRNKRLGAAAERRAADIYGTSRFPANTGGPLDLVEFAGHFVQVKAGGTITMSTILEGLAAAKLAAAPSHGLAAVHVEYHRNRKVAQLIVFDAKEYADFCGFGTA